MISYAIKDLSTGLYLTDRKPPHRWLPLGGATKRMTKDKARSTVGGCRNNTKRGHLLVIAQLNEPDINTGEIE